MRDLIKHELKFELVFPFFQNTLAGANSLSIELIKNFKQEDGHFFTMLPEEANLEYLYRFKYGCILPQNPVKYGPIGNLGNQYYSETPSISDEIAKIIEDILHQNTNVSCIIDDVTRISSHKVIQNSDEQFKSCTSYSGKEIYYILNKDNATFNLTIKCLERSIGFWHSLCILSKTPLKEYVGKQLDKSILSQICRNAQTIIVGAYDAEGYIFWEKSQTPVKAK